MDSIKAQQFAHTFTFMYTTGQNKTAQNINNTEYKPIMEQWPSG